MDSSDLWSDSDSDFDSTDWECRIEHLISTHNFDGCDAHLRFYRPEQFLLHLSERHNLQLGSWMKDIVESCRREVCMADEIFEKQGCLPR